jgi:hypothetical protein
MAAAASISAIRVRRRLSPFGFPFELFFRIDFAIYLIICNYA